jgi:hypothetical protein
MSVPSELPSRFKILLLDFIRTKEFILGSGKTSQAVRDRAGILSADQINTNLANDSSCLVHNL